MNFYCIGISHHTAPIDVREQLWFSPDEVTTTLHVLKETCCSEGVLVSTCNRTEFYYVPRGYQENGEPLWKVLTHRKNAEAVVREKHFYTYTNADAIKHLFAVASGIDSMVLGDVQILSQMKDAFARAQEAQCTGGFLNRVFHTAFRVGKRARNETEIGDGAVSISYAAAELALKIFEDLSKRSALLIGAGETGKLTAQHLFARELGSLLITNRTRDRAEELVDRLGGRVIDYGKMAEALPHVDIVISSVETNEPILRAADVRQAMKLRGNRPLFIIDIGVPRNVDPAANTIDNVFLHDIDALNHIVDRNLAHRKAEIPRIESIIEEEMAEFTRWYDSLELAPTIQELHSHFENIRRLEIERNLKHFPGETRHQVEVLTKQIINKLLHDPTVNLKNGGGEEDTEIRSRVATLRYLFGLDKREEPE